LFAIDISCRDKGKAVVEIAAIDAVVNHLLKMWSPEPVFVSDYLETVIARLDPAIQYTASTSLP
jgi:hypothetical protein